MMKWLKNASNGTISAGGNGAGTLYSQVYYPSGVFVDSFGTIYISELDSYRISKWPKGATNGMLVAGIPGSVGNTSQQLSSPTGMTFDTNGNLYVADTSNNRVQKSTIINNTPC
jgi:sugar lactone lactonase YvrE